MCKDKGRTGVTRVWVWGERTYCHLLCFFKRLPEWWLLPFWHGPHPHLTTQCPAACNLLKHKTLFSTNFQLRAQSTSVLCRDFCPYSKNKATLNSLLCLSTVTWDAFQSELCLANLTVIFYVPEMSAHLGFGPFQYGYSSLALCCNPFLSNEPFHCPLSVLSTMPFGPPLYWNSPD